MTEALILDRDALTQAYRRLQALYRTMTGKRGRRTRLYGVFEVIIHAYPDMGAEVLVERIESLVADRPEIRRVIEAHSPGAPDYVEDRDWLYDGPEALVVADLARDYPSRLRAVAGTADFGTDLEAMAEELNGR